MMEEAGREDLGLTIMAMKGSSREWNRVVASNLARFLKCPLVDTHDIDQALQNSSSSSPSSSQTNNNEMAEESPALDVAYGVASTQLSLKIPVIINGAHPLTLETTWQPLAASSGARLIVIECHPPEDKVGQQQSDGEDDHDGIALVHVDAESFDGKKAEGIVSKIHLLLRQQEEHNTTTHVAGGKIEKAKQRKQRRRSDHLHQWVEKQPNSTNENTTDDDWLCLACDAGDPFLLEAYYRCTDCDFALHKSCAEQPYYHAVLDECPPYLKAVRPQSYDFPSKVKCRNCRDGSGEEEFSAVDDCHDCLMQTNLRHKSLPTVLRNKDAHQHRLNLVIMPFGYDYKYLCARCEAIGYSVGYKCYECNELPNFHVACALLQWWPSPIKLLEWVPASWPEEGKV